MIMTNMTRRLFIAVSVPETIKKEIAALQRHLGRHDCPVRWVRPRALHITLRFLGDTPEHMLSQVKEALHTAAAAVEEAEICVEGTGFFPHARHPKVIWAGITQGADALTRLANALNGELERCGFDAEKRPFSPHITIGRIKHTGNADLLANDSERVFPGMVMPLRDVHLIESDLRPTGPVYTVLGTYNLKGYRRYDTTQ